MKWVFILLLITNVLYLVWEMDREQQLNRKHISTAIRVPIGTPRLQLLSELEKRPEMRSNSKLNTRLSVENFNSEPVLPVALNPNTESLVETFLTTSPVQEDSSTNKTNNENAGRATYVSPTATVCYTYGPIPSLKESRLLSDWLDERGIQYRQRQTDEQDKELFWVYLTPQGSRASAEAVVQDIKSKDVTDMRSANAGDLSNAISLGLFSSQAAVNRRLNGIKVTGYQSVVIPHSKEKKIHWLDVSIVKESHYVSDFFTGFPARFKALPIDCNEIAMQ